MTRPRAWASVALLACCVLAARHARASRSAPAPDADSLYHRAIEQLSRGTPDDRRLALRDLSEAARAAGARAEILNAVARAYTAMGEHDRARACLDQVTRLAPDDADSQLQLGLLWKWEWLASLESSSYGRAIEHLLRSARLSPSSLEPRLALTALALARNNVPLALTAAQSAVVCDRGAAETALALACASYRAGELARADSAMRAALPRLPAALRPRFTDLAGIRASARAVPRSAEEADSVATSFWEDKDPDLTTAENEAELDFFARVAHAVLLFREAGGVRWDMRAELFARYGVPATIQLPPPPSGDQDVFSYLSLAPMLQGGIMLDPRSQWGDHIGFPFHMQTWIYPELGLSVDLWDRSLDQSYVLPVAHFQDADPRPEPRRMAARPDLLALQGGLGVYRALPPGVSSMPARAAMARFPSDQGTRLVAHVETEGSPADSLWGSWAVVGANGHVLARTRCELTISACDPTGRRVAQFDAVVPPGDYRVHIAVEDRRGHRGVVRLESSVGPPELGFVLSDLVMVCGTLPGTQANGPVWIEPNFDHRLGRSRALSVYFEVGHLAVGTDGRSHFRYRYVVRGVAQDGQPGPGAQPAFEATREEENAGPFRRQFVSAPIQALAPGLYEFEIDVLDLGSGATAKRAVRFVKE